LIHTGADDRYPVFRAVVMGCAETKETPMQARKRISLLVLPVVIAMPALAAHAADAQPSQTQAQMEQAAATGTITATPTDAKSVSDANAAATPTATAAATTTSAPQQAAKTDGQFGVAMSDDQLSERRGGDALVGQNNLTGTVSDNTAYKVQTGSNAIAGGSFANTNGLPTVIQNTGANVLIQNATVLNVRFGD
jgi:hypothetical protein